MKQTFENLLEDRHGNYILPFFWQRGEEEAVLREYMHVIKEANISAVCVESRPHPDFCGDKWWADMDAILDEARKLDMKVWILDDSHFPTGFANGAMENQPHDIARRSICCQKYEVKANEEFILSADEVRHPAEMTLSQTEAQIKMMTGRGADTVPQSEFEDDALVGISYTSSEGKAIDLSGCIEADGSFRYTPDEDGVIYKMNHTRNRGPHQNYINMTDRDSCRVLIDAVYEQHLAHYADDFGKTIAGFFSDEPELGNGHLYELHHEMGIGFDMDYPWGRELEENLRDELKDDFATMLPLIWETSGDEAVRARYRYIYMDNLTRLVENNFSNQVGDWCRSHGVEYIGHIIEDNGQHCRTGSTLGHYFRSLFGQDMSGIDDIGGQVYPQGEDDNYDMGTFMVRNGEFYHFMLGKLANSLAALDDKKKGNAMCEIFGNYGWGEGLRLEKYLADHFMVRGVNHYVPHAFSAQPFPDPDCPPHFYAHGHNPQYKAFGELMKYMNRSIELISDGRHIAPVAVIYHAEAEWTGKSMPAEKVARALTESQIDFDFVPFDAFDDKEKYHTQITADGLHVNTQCYRMVIVPYMQFVDNEFVRDIVQLTDKGIKVYFVDNAPDCAYNCGNYESGCTFCPECENYEFTQAIATAETIALDEVAKVAEDVAELSFAPADKYLRYYHYVKVDGAEVIMLVNEGTDTYEGELNLDRMCEGKEVVGIYAYDSWNDKIYSTDYSDGRLSISLPAGKSRFLLLIDDEATDKSMSDRAVPEVSLPVEAVNVAFAEEWRRSVIDGVNYPDFGECTRVSLPDDYAKIDPKFSGWLRYENSFDAESGKRYFVEITDAFETVEVYINDERTGLQIYAPYLFDITSAVQNGTNSIRIEITTTLERATFDIPDRFGRPKNEPVCGSGITGVVNMYTVAGE